MKLLVLTPEPVDADLPARAPLGDEVEGAEVLVVSPATNQSPLAFWVSDSDEAIAEAEHAQEETVERLEEAGVDAAGDTGESEPAVALQDALATLRRRPDRRLLAPRRATATTARTTGLAEAEQRFGDPGHARRDRPLSRPITGPRGRARFDRAHNKPIGSCPARQREVSSPGVDTALREHPIPPPLSPLVPSKPGMQPAMTVPRTNSVTASQARAARQREARRDEQAVAAWLREPSGALADVASLRGCGRG